MTNYVHCSLFFGAGGTLFFATVTGWGYPIRCPLVLTTPGVQAVAMFVATVLQNREGYSIFPTATGSRLANRKGTGFYSNPVPPASERMHPRGASERSELGVNSEKARLEAIN